MADATVLAVDRGLWNRLQLGESRTDERGEYSIEYLAGDDLLAAKSGVNLVVEVVDADKHVLATSDIRFDAAPREVVNLLVRADAGTELRQVLETLSPALRGGALAELGDGSLSLLAGMTGLGEEVVRDAAGAERLATLTGLPAAGFFALSKRRRARAQGSEGGHAIDIEAELGLDDEEAERLRAADLFGRIARYDAPLVAQLVERWRAGAILSPMELAIWDHARRLELLESAWSADALPDWTGTGDRAARLRKGANVLAERVGRAFPQKRLSRHLVHGRIVTPSGRPAADLTVELIHHGREGEAPISPPVLTDSRGRYRAVVDPAVLGRVIGRGATLQLEVRVSDGDGQALGSTGLRRGASIPVEIDLAVVREVGPTEFEAVGERLRGVGFDTDGGTLPEPATLEWLAGATGVDRERIRRFAEAHCVEVEHPELTPEALYVLQGMDPEAPVARRKGRVERRLKAAVTQHVVSERALQFVPAGERWLDKRAVKLCAERLRRPAREGAPAGRVDVVRAAGLAEEDLEHYVSLVAEDAEAEPATLRARLDGSGISPEGKTRIRRAERLREIVGPERDLVGRLVGETMKPDNPQTDGGEAPGDGDDDERVLGRLARRGRSDWEGWLGAETDLPVRKRRVRARELEDAFEHAYPREALLGRLESRAEADGEARRSVDLDAVRGFLERHEGLNLRGGGLEYQLRGSASPVVRGETRALREAVDAYLREQTSGDAPDVLERRGERLEIDLTRLQRLGRIARFDDAIDLLAWGYPSARAVATEDRESFVERLAGTGGPDTAGDATDELEARRDEVREIHRRARRRAAEALIITTGLHGTFKGVTPGVVPGLGGGKDDRPDDDDDREPPTGGAGGGETRPLGETKADLESLFGAFDACAVAPCQSVLGEAAYLVDLLQLLAREAFSGASDALAALLARRPDLAHIELSCPNSETPLPCIDLVIELLERQLDLPATPAENFPRANTRLVPHLRPEALLASGSVERPTPWPQTTWTAAELALHPEHLNRKVYERLADATFPWSLPFLLAHEEADTYLGALDTSRAELMRRLVGHAPIGSGTPEASRLARAELRIGGTEHALLTAGVGADEWQWWGYDSRPSEWPSALGKRVSAFLRRTGLEYVDLLELLECRYVNPEGDGRRAVRLEVDDGTDACDVTKMRLVGIDEAFLNRFQRFVRLRRCLGWSVRETDQAIAHLGPGHIGVEFLVKVATARRVARRLRLAPIDALALWGDLDTQARFDRSARPPEALPSQYERLFQDRRRLGKDERAKLSLSLTPEPDLAVVGPIAATAIGLSAADYALLVDADPDGPRSRWQLSAPSVAASTSLLAALSALHRWWRLADSTGRSINELLRFAALSAIDPFAAPRATLRFVEALDLLEESTLGVDDLDFLLRHVSGVERRRRFEEGVLDTLQRVCEQSARQAGAGEITAGLVRPLLVGELARVHRLSAPLADELLRWAEGEADGSTPGLDTVATLVAAEAGGAGDVLIGTETLTASPAWPTAARLAKAAWLASRLGWTLDDVRAGLGAQHPFELLALDALPVAAQSSAPAGAFEGWQELASLGRLLARFSDAGSSLWTVRAAAVAATAAGAEIGSSWAEVSRRLGSSVDDAAALVGPSLLDFDVAAGNAAPRTWLRFLDAVELVELLQVPVARLSDWTADALDLASASEIRDTVAARLGAETWQRVGQRLRGEIRVRQRDALADGARHELGLPSTDALGNHLLVDVEIGAAQMSSRLRLATASVQRFVQRALLGVERSTHRAPLVLPESFTELWEWFRSFRSWRDNRALFLYPENYLRPELRDDKTPFFAEVEQALSQRELTEEALEDAIGLYLDRLEQTARLQVMGTCVEPTASGRVLHIVARTSAVPHEHYHRTWDFASERFTPWVRMDLDIDGDWALPVMRDGRMTLYWLRHKRQVEGLQDTLGMIPARPFPLAPHLPAYQDQYSLSWSTKRRKGWTEKRSAERYIARPFAPILPTQFAVRVDGERIKIGGVSTLPAMPQLGLAGGDDVQALISGPRLSYPTVEDLVEAGVRIIGEGFEAGRESIEALIDDTTGGSNGAGSAGDGAGGTPAIADLTPDIAGVLEALAGIAGTVDSVLDAVTGGESGWSIQQGFEEIWKNIPDIDAPELPPALRTLLGNLESALVWATETKVELEAHGGSILRWAVTRITQVLADLVKEILLSVESGEESGPAQILSGRIMLLSKKARRLIFEVLSELEFVLGGPTLGFEFGHFDVGPTGAKALRLAPPPGALNPLSPSAFAYTLGTEIPALLFEPGKALAYTNFPGYPAFFDVPTQTDVLWTNLSRGGSGPEALGARAWPGCGFVYRPSMGTLQAQGFCTIALNLEQVRDEELAGLDVEALKSSIVSPPKGGTPGVLELLDTASLMAATLEERADDLSALFNLGMRVVRPVPLEPFPGRLFAPEPTILGEDRWGRTFLLLPRPASRTIPIRKGRKANGSAIRWSAVALYHPLGAVLNRAYERGGIDGIFESASRPAGEAWTYEVPDAFAKSFVPTHPDAIEVAEPAEERLDFSARGSHSIYNWELLYHLPLLVGGKYGTYQNFDHAIRWYRKVFDPTVAHGKAPQRFWRFKPFHEEYADSGPRTISRWLRDLAASAGGGEELDMIAAWRRDPFNPHLVARLRPGAYERAVVLRTIESLIAWGDLKFREESWEAIQEATQLYLLARELLGPRPQLVPARPVDALTYAELARRAREEGSGIDGFGNALLEVESALPDGASGAKDDGEGSPEVTVLNGASMLYFSIPPNERLLGYWDTVDDRLRKIRQSLDIRGRARSPYPEGLAPSPDRPPEAAAASGFAGGSKAVQLPSTPNYRFEVMLQKAYEFARDVRAHGAALLAALEKRDAEALARLRTRHESDLLLRAEQVRKLQLTEAREALAALEQGREGARLRHDYYTSREFINTAEQVKEALFLLSSGLQLASGGQELAAGVLSAMPNVTFGVGGVASSPQVTATYGSTQLAGAVSAVARAFSLLASAAQTGSAMAGSIASYQRRQEEWDLQASLAANDIEQTERQIMGAEERVAIAERELENHREQIARSEEMASFMREKFTNEELYEWMESEASVAHFQSYLLAVDIAKRAEAAYRYERAQAATNFVRVEAWDGMAGGLLAGERLEQDLRRMEAAYLDANEREHELTKHISLAQVNPVALLLLQRKGQCVVDLPERLFDADHPGMYLRRIKTLAVSIPCVVGPYTGVHCTLTLSRSEVRVDKTAPDSGADYPRADPADGDPRFRDDLVPRVLKMVTSSGQNDSGLFEANLRDERYLPFEGAGAISTWRIELPRETNRFDFSSIPDVVLHLRYTARDDAALREAAWDWMFGSAAAPQALVRMFSARSEWPDAWARFVSPSKAQPDAILHLDLSASRFSYRHEGQAISIRRLRVVMLTSSNATAQGVKARLSYVPDADDTPNEATPSPGVFETPTDLAGIEAATFTPGAESAPGAWRLSLRADDNPSPLPTILTSPSAGTLRVKAKDLRDVIVLCEHEIAL